MLIYSRVNEISTLSSWDFVCLVAHYNTLMSGEKHKVSSSAQTRGYSPEVLAEVGKRFSDKFNPVESCNLRFIKPFDHLKFEPISYVLILFENYERGRLPFPGSTSEQPAQIMEIFSVLHQLKVETQSRTTKQQWPKPQSR